MRRRRLATASAPVKPATHEQNLLLPWVNASELPALWQTAQELGLARPNIGLLTDIIAARGDFARWPMPARSRSPNPSPSVTGPRRAV